MTKFYCPNSTLVKNAQNRPAKACRYARKVRAPAFFYFIFAHRVFLKLDAAAAPHFIVLNGLAETSIAYTLQPMWLKQAVESLRKFSSRGRLLSYTPRDFLNSNFYLRAFFKSRGYYGNVRFRGLLRAHVVHF